MLKKMLRFSWLIIILSVALTVFFALQLRGIEIENTIRLFIPHNGEDYGTLLKTEDTFGSMITMGISLETKDKTIITPQNIAIVEKISDAIESVKYVEDVSSITTIDYVYGEDGTLSAGSLLGDDYTGSEEDMRRIREKIFDWEEMYNRVILTDDGKTTQIMVVFEAKDENGKSLSGSKQSASLSEIKRITEEAVSSANLEVRFFGDPVMSDNMRTFVLNDLIMLIPFVVLVVLLSLYFSFHSLAGTLLPLVTVLMSTVWSCGIIAILGITFTIIASVIPVCLIACGSAYGIHVLTHYYAALDEVKGEITKEKHADAIVAGLKDVWVAVILAAITTIAGFISNVTSPMEPLRTFSIFSAAGVAFSLLLSVTLIPALLYVTPLSKVTKRNTKKNVVSDKLKAKIERELIRRGGKSQAEAESGTFYSIYHFAAGTKPRLVIFLVLILIFSIVGIRKIIVDTAMVNYFPPESQFRKDIAYADENLSGTNSVYIVIEGTSPFKQAIDAMEEDAVKGKVASLKKALSSLPPYSPPSLLETNPQETSASDFDDFGFDDFGFSDSEADSSAADTDFGGFDFQSDFAAEDFGFDANGAVDSDSDFFFSDDSASSADTVSAALENFAALVNSKSPSKQELLQSYINLQNLTNSEFRSVMTNPEILKAIDDMNNFLQSKYSGIGKIVSFTTFLKRMNQVMHAPQEGETPESLSQTLTMQEVLTALHSAYTSAGGKNANASDIVSELEKSLNFNGSNYYEVPYDVSKYLVERRSELSDLVTQYLYLLSSDDMSKFTDDMTAPSSLRTQVQLSTHNTEYTGQIIDDVAEYSSEHFPEGYIAKVTGNGEMEYVMTAMVIRNQFTSIIFSLIMVFIILSISFKSPLAGLIGAIPLTITIILNFMVMGFAKINLDFVTSIIASVAIGVGIDYTIHFMEIYRSKRVKDADLERITKETFKTTGRGIVTNAVAVGLGFLVLMFSNFVILRYIGILVAIVMLTSSFSAMTVIPGILNIFDPKFTHPAKKNGAQD